MCKFIITLIYVLAYKYNTPYLMNILLIKALNHEESGVYRRLNEL